MSTVDVQINGTSVPALEGGSTRRLNRPSQGTAKVPIDSAFGETGDLLRIYIDGNLHHHGRIMNFEAEGEEDTGYCTYNSVDPMELWTKRPVRDNDGDFSLPDLITDFVTGPQIIHEALNNSAIYEGELFINFGSEEGGGVDLTGAPTDWPMTIAELADLLVSTGELDIVFTPIVDGAAMAQVDTYNGDYGTDRTGSVIFQYATGSRNVRKMSRNEDMSDMCNKLWYYLGPRVLTALDPAGDQHWRANITADDPDLADPPQTDIESLRAASQGQYGVRMDIKIFDAQGDENPSAFRELYRRLWQMEQWIRSQPRRMVHFEPTRETAIGSFDIGDLITVQAGSSFMGGFSGAQRVYEYTIGWDADTVFLSNISGSPNGEGI